MQEKQRRQWPNISSTSSLNDGPIFDASARADLWAPVFDSIRTLTIVPEEIKETITLGEKHAIDRVSSSFSPG